MFKAWNTETRLLMRLDSFETVKGELRKPHHILLQYTGVSDKSGEQLYEMDIVLISSARYVIAWDEARSGWCFAPEDEAQQRTPLTTQAGKAMSRLCSWFESEKNS